MTEFSYFCERLSLKFCTQSEKHSIEYPYLDFFFYAQESNLLNFKGAKCIS